MSFLGTIKREKTSVIDPELAEAWKNYDDMKKSNDREKLSRLPAGKRGCKTKKKCANGSIIERGKDAFSDKVNW